MLRNVKASDGHRVPSLAQRVAKLNWDAIGDSLDRDGFVTTGRLLSPQDCAGLVALFAEERRFRSHIVMARHGYGAGEYKYFGYPLPRPIETLRTRLYEKLVPVANRWSARLGAAAGFPPKLKDYLTRCHEAGQSRPTPLLLRYGAGDYNRLHQDRYGELAFPLQATVCLSRRGKDFSGGEFMLVEQRPRMQSRGDVIDLDQGEMVIFANRERPVAGSRGDFRVQTRHGVSRLHSGERYALGIIFHDAA